MSVLGEKFNLQIIKIVKGDNYFNNNTAKRS
jgi:hypothetical protein